jgi:hypothetical protein
MYQNFIISYLYEAQHVSGDTPPIVASCWNFLHEFYYDARIHEHQIISVIRVNF